MSDAVHNRATRVATVLLGSAAGGAGVEHGDFEVLRGPGRPEGLFIASMGPPCDPEAVWHACEPALTIVPDYLASGMLSIAFGRSWPWPLVAFLVLLAGQWLIGAIANDVLLRSAFLIPVVVLVLLAATVGSALAHDRMHAGAR